MNYIKFYCIKCKAIFLKNPNEFSGTILCPYCKIPLKVDINYLIEETILEEWKNRVSLNGLEKTLEELNLKKLDIPEVKNIITKYLKQKGLIK